MKIILQRVSAAKVEVSSQLKGKIGRGYLLLLGIGKDDDIDDITWLVNKILNLRLFPDKQNKMNLSLKDTNGEVLLISQFTLFASTKKGNRPSFTSSMNPDSARNLYQQFIDTLEAEYKKIETGIFGANMQVTLTNDGPVTISIDSKERF